MVTVGIDSSSLQASSRPNAVGLVWGQCRLFFLCFRYIVPCSRTRYGKSEFTKSKSWPRNLIAVTGRRSQAGTWLDV